MRAPSSPAITGLATGAATRWSVYRASHLRPGRIDVAKKILRTFARFLDRGMLPNVFPDLGTTPEYNTVDAALWFFEAVRQTVEVEVPGRENSFLEEMYQFWPKPSTDTFTAPDTASTWTPPMACSS